MMKVIFFGTPTFAANVLTFLMENGVNVVAVISKPDKPKGRSGKPVATPVKLVAYHHHLPLFQPEVVSDPDFVSVLDPFEADLFVVVAYGEILKQHILDMPKLACINLHASLLPKFRGAAPIQQAIINGEAESGVTIMHMVKKMDAGDMIKTAAVPIGPNETYGELEEKLCKVGSELLLEVIRDFEQGIEDRKPQDESLVTFAKKIELEDCKIDWNHPAQKIHDLIRGVNPAPGAWCDIKVRGESKRLKIFSTRVVEGKGSPGAVLSKGKQGITVACADNALLITELQLEGKKRMSAQELLTGLGNGELSF
jgi:methionyl-tRNA formyltransferase